MNFFLWKCFSIKLISVRAAFVLTVLLKEVLNAAIEKAFCITSFDVENRISGPSSNPRRGFLHFNTLVYEKKKKKNSKQDLLPVKIFQWSEVSKYFK